MVRRGLMAVSIPRSVLICAIPSLVLLLTLVWLKKRKQKDTTSASSPSSSPEVRTESLGGGTGDGHGVGGGRGPGREEVVKKGPLHLIGTEIVFPTAEVVPLPCACDGDWNREDKEEEEVHGTVRRDLEEGLRAEEDADVESLLRSVSTEVSEEVVVVGSLEEEDTDYVNGKEDIVEKVVQVLREGQGQSEDFTSDFPQEGEVGSVVIPLREEESDSENKDVSVGGGELREEHVQFPETVTEGIVDPKEVSIESGDTAVCKKEEEENQESVTFVCEEAVCETCEFPEKSCKESGIQSSDLNQEGDEVKVYESVVVPCEEEDPVNQDSITVVCEEVVCVTSHQKDSELLEGSRGEESGIESGVLYREVDELGICPEGDSPTTVDRVFGPCTEEDPLIVGVTEAVEELEVHLDSSDISERVCGAEKEDISDLTVPIEGEKDVEAEESPILPLTDSGLGEKSPIDGDELNVCKEDTSTTVVDSVVVPCTEEGPVTVHVREAVGEEVSTTTSVRDCGAEEEEAHKEDLTVSIEGKDILAANSNLSRDVELALGDPKVSEATVEVDKAQVPEACVTGVPETKKGVTVRVTRSTRRKMKQKATATSCEKVEVNDASPEQGSKEVLELQEAVERLQVDVAAPEPKREPEPKKTRKGKTEMETRKIISNGGTNTSAYGSASHSPTEEMLESSTVSNYSDLHSEGSSDSGNGGSEIHLPLLLETTALANNHQGNMTEDPAPRQVTAMPLLQFFEFELPQSLCGRLIGQGGRFVKLIKAKTHANISIKNHPISEYIKLCTIIGTNDDIAAALAMIRRKFPESRYPEVTLHPITLPMCGSFAVPETLQLQLPEGIVCDVVLSSMVNAGHFFLQQPTHPTYPSLSRLDQFMLACYMNAGTAPEVPRPIEAGFICATPMMGGWYRSQVVNVYADTDECDVKFVDYGGFARVANSSLHQIRSDFMTLPFQASECYLANVAPVDETEGWTLEACAAFEELAQGQILQSQIVSYSSEGIPCVHLFRIQGAATTFINRELVNNGFAFWVDQEE